jgi:hypothetical protein
MTALVSSVISHTSLTAACTFGFLGSLDKVPVISVSEMITKKSLINEWNSVGCVFTSLSSTSRNEGFSCRDAIVVCFSRWMQWLLTSHVRRYHRHCGSSGHVWQGRFKAFPIQ